MGEHIEIRTLGELAVVCDNLRVTGFEQLKELALLVYLAYHRREHQREVLAEMLWEGRTRPQGLKNLSVALHGLSQRVGAAVERTRYTLAIPLESSCWIDAAEFESLTTDPNSKDNIAALEKAARLYQGDFLDGFWVDSAAFEEWMLSQQRYLRWLAIEALDRLVVCHVRENNLNQALAHANRLDQLDPLRSRTCRLFMEIFARRDERDRALDFFRTFRDRLKHELDDEPDRETGELYERIRSGELPTESPVLLPVSLASTALPSPTAVATVVRSPEAAPLRAERLFGRTTQLSEVLRLLHDQQRVLLQGLGGMGKTVLAAEVAAVWLAEGHGPVLWLHAGTASVEALFEAIARPFDQHQRIAAAAERARPQMVREMLTESGLRLVVIDDAWEGRALHQVISALPHHIPALVTSRQRLPVGPILTVGELSPRDAIDLLSSHAFQFFPPGDPDALSLCRGLGFHPFAIEIAGKTLHVYNFTPAELMARMGQNPHNLRMPGDFVEQGRESVKQLLDASLAALEPAQRDIFLAFGALFTPTATPDLLASCLQLSPEVAADLMVQLQQRGLVERESSPPHEITVYRVHDLAYSYVRANALLNRSTVFPACRQYITHHANTLPALDAEIGNLLGAAHEAVRVHDHDSLITILHGLTVESPYFKARGHDSFLLDLMDRAIDAARQHGAPYLTILHFLLGKRGDAAYDRGDLDGALRCYQESFELACRLELAQREVVLLCVTSKVYSDRGNFAAAEDTLKQAQRIADAAQDDALSIRVLEQLGYYYVRARKDYAAAQHVYAQQVRMAENLSDPERLFFALQNLGASEIDLGQLEPALDHLHRALDLARQLDHHLWIAHTLYPLGAVYHRMECSEEAQQCLAEALELYRSSGNFAKVNELIAFMSEHGYAVSVD